MTLTLQPEVALTAVTTQPQMAVSLIHNHSCQASYTLGYNCIKSVIVCFVFKIEAYCNVFKRDVSGGCFLFCHFHSDCPVTRCF